MVDAAFALSGGGSTASVGVDGLLLSDNFYSDGTLWTVAVTGVVQGDYDVFIYAPAHPSVESGTLSVEGIPVASFPGDSALNEGVSHTSLTIAVTDGELNIVGLADSFSGLAGFQLIPLIGSELIFCDDFESGTTAAW